MTNTDTQNGRASSNNINSSSLVFLIGVKFEKTLQFRSGLFFGLAQISRTEFEHHKKNAIELQGQAAAEQVDPEMYSQDAIAVRWRELARRENSSVSARFHLAAFLLLLLLHILRHNIKLAKPTTVRNMAEVFFFSFSLAFFLLPLLLLGTQFSTHFHPPLHVSYRIFFAPLFEHRFSYTLADVGALWKDKLVVKICLIWFCFSLSYLN